MAKNNNSMWWIIGLLFVAVVWYGGTHDWFKSTFSLTNPQTPLPNEVIKEYGFYDVSLTISPNEICVGNLVTGKIDSNINNGICSLFVDTGGGYKLLTNIRLDSSGKFSQSERINTIGTAVFVAVCCDANNNCKLSNTDTLRVISCDNDNDGIPDEVDTDDDNDGYSDEDEIAAGTDPTDPNSHPEGDDPCPVYCQGLGGYSTGRLVSSPGYCNAPEISVFYPPRDGYCCCMPEQEESKCVDFDGKNIYNKGWCEDSVNQLGFEDTCMTTRLIKEYFCVDGMCVGWNTDCPIGYICANGACVQQDCNSIVSPTSQSSCQYGYCESSGLCTFIPATNVEPARCGCPR